MDKYEKGQRIGEGTYGNVFQAIDKTTGRLVAIKKLRCSAGKVDGQPDELREVRMLRELQAPHVVELLEVIEYKNKLALVFEYMESDLERVMRERGSRLPADATKAYMQKVLEALAFIHGRGAVHRDIKPDNLLVNGKGELKLGDFGLATVLKAENRCLTNQVFSRWYKAPEILFGSTNYGAAADMWATGCVFAEMLLGKPWLPGGSDLDQLDRIFKARGVPTPVDWPDMVELPDYVEWQPALPQQLEAQFPAASAAALELLAALTVHDPAQRLTAAAALQHRYFSEAPPPCPPELLPPLPKQATSGKRMLRHICPNMPLPSSQSSCPDAKSCGTLSAKRGRAPPSPLDLHPAAKTLHPDGAAAAAAAAKPPLPWGAPPGPRSSRGHASNEPSPVDQMPQHLPGSFTFARQFPNHEVQSAGDAIQCGLRPRGWPPAHMAPITEDAQLHTGLPGPAMADLHSAGTSGAAAAEEQLGLRWPDCRGHDMLAGTGPGHAGLPREQCDASQLDQRHGDECGRWQAGDGGDPAGDIAMAAAQAHQGIKRGWSPLQPDDASDMALSSGMTKRSRSCGQCLWRDSPLPMSTEAEPESECSPLLEGEEAAGQLPDSLRGRVSRPALSGHELVYLRQRMADVDGLLLQASQEAPCDPA